MTLIVFGFTSHISALQFEWTWQHPLKSRHFRAALRDPRYAKDRFGIVKWNVHGMLWALSIILGLPMWRKTPLQVCIPDPEVSGLFLPLLAREAIDVQLHHTPIEELPYDFADRGKASGKSVIDL
jgi:hypothetical protein